MIDLAARYALDIPAILECVDKSYLIRPFFSEWEISWDKNDKRAHGATIREALATFKRTVASTYIDPEEG